MKQPPAFNKDLTDNCIEMLKWAPLIMIINGWWMVGNKQIFENKWYSIEQADDSMLSGHTLGKESVNWSSPLILIGAAAFILTMTQKFFGKYMAKWGFAL